MCTITQADGTLESPPPEDAPSPRPSKRPRLLTGDTASAGTAGDESAQEVTGPRSEGGDRQTRQDAAHDSQPVSGRSTDSDPSHHQSPTKTAASPRTASAVTGRPGRAAHASSRLGNGGAAAHASARSASLGERRSIQLLLSAVVEELHRHESEPAGGARLTLDPPRAAADAGVASTHAEDGPGKGVSAGQATGPHAEQPGGSDVRASAWHTAGATIAAASSNGGRLGAATLPPGSTAPIGGAYEPHIEAPHRTEPRPPAEVMDSAPGPAPRRGPQPPPVSPFAALQSSGSLPDREATDADALEARHATGSACFTVRREASAL